MINFRGYMLKRNLKIIFNIILLIVDYILITLFLGNDKILNLILLILITSLFSLSFILNFFKFRIISRFFYVLFIGSSTIISGYCLLKVLGFFDVFSSITSLKEYIVNTSSKGVIIYILIQALQVIFLPIPAAVICIVGSVIYGPFLGAIYCSIGVILGSFVSFFIGKTFGYRLVSWIVGIENTNKYTQILSKNGGLFLVIAFLLPMFPDDILCLIAGITKMKFRTFGTVTTITRPIGVIFMAFFGSGSIIPFNGWGIIVWGVIFVIALLIVYLSYKKQNEIQSFIYFAESIQEEGCIER